MSDGLDHTETATVSLLGDLDHTVINDSFDRQFSFLLQIRRCQAVAGEKQNS